MIILSVLYPKTEQSRFDFDYYVAKHIPFVKERFGGFGLQDVRLMRGTAALGGAAPTFEVIAELLFPSMQQLADGLSKHGQEVMADIAAFTDVQPAIQVNEPL